MSFIGIDVAKAQLEFAVRPSGATGTVLNDDAGIRALGRRPTAPAFVGCISGLGSTGQEPPHLLGLPAAGNSPAAGPQYVGFTLDRQWIWKLTPDFVGDPRNPYRWKKLADGCYH